MSRVFFSNPLMSDVEADWSPIHDAAFNGRTLTLKRLIEQGACVNLSTLDGASPLHVACVGGHAACAKLLLQHGANVDCQSLDGSPIHVAAAKGKRFCIGHASVCIVTVFHTGYLECIETLAQHCADVDLSLGRSGTPLHVACINQQLNAVKKLLYLGADVNNCAPGESPLHVSVRTHNPEMVSVLLEYGADTSLRNSDSKRPGDLAHPGSDVEKLLTQNRGIPTLMQLCRLHIRTVLGKRRLCIVPHLQLPASLKNYLLWRS
ncbi:ankyrin repeat and SOCS box protein 9-like isoform X1 [Corythoichthys intestinalis]|uniref:ankyrin repeat and SOCS box protein 9-like isoform X1 n=1 Tax=Corythoichthys intestinalis TaxID=161448 RepID=UPI0025A68803|nr:ankyrin repeat and SOCS box protein 9-like isoform X1 [Corythoichthys intestinalis]